jgi:hypothetical protein
MEPIRTGGQNEGVAWAPISYYEAQFAPYVISLDLNGLGSKSYDTKGFISI